MRIVYTCHDSLPSPDTNTQQTFWTTFEVARIGVSVDMVVPSLALAASTETDVRRGLAAYYGASADEWPPTFRVTASGTSAAGSMRKGWFDWSVVRGARDADLIWTRDPVAAASAVQAGRPTVFETYRPDYATRSIFAVWRRACLGSPHLHTVITHSALAAAAYRNAGVPSHKILVAHNGFTPSLLQPRLTRDQARRQIGIDADAPLAVYAGQTGVSKGVESLVHLAADIPSMTLLIVGADAGSDDGRRLLREAAACGAGNVILRARVPLADVAPYLYAADCLLIPPTAAPMRKFRNTVLPMKVFMYMAAGRPILAGRLPDIEEVLTDGETARLVPADDRREASMALVALFADQQLRARLSCDALDASRHHTWAARARRIVDFLEGHIRNPRASSADTVRA
ncbi:MAG TPA: glycosyltransferase [Vicinamibacterales bacterium]|nr:glycosyltransferase [Vicinamibacterales bacterium]